MSISDEVLMAYADGELDTKGRAEVESAMAVDPQIARRVAEHEALRATLRSTYDAVLNEPIPHRLVAAAVRGRGASDNPREAGSPAGTVGQGADDRGVVVPLRPRGTRTPAVPYWGAIAASFVVGALVWHFGTEWSSGAPVVERNGQLLASGTLARALSSQLVVDQKTPSSVQIGITFRSKSGSYCRTFQLQGDGTLAGLACREQDMWRLDVLARGERPQPGQPEFRPAGSALPPAIADAVDRVIEGDPLDAQAESRARSNRWRP